MASSVPVLQSRVLYGLKTDVAGNAHYITDTDILYPVGSALSIHNFAQRRQRLVRLPVDKHQINIIAVTPNKKYVAVCEIGEKPTINIYDLNTLKRKKSLGIPYDAPGVTRFSCVSFSLDSRCLAAVTGEPAGGDQTMLYYAWEKGKVESSMKLVNSQNPQSTVKYIACNPADTGALALGGPYILKLLTVSETVWRPYGFGKADNIIITSLTWLNTDRLLAGTRDGRILYLENGDLKNIYKMSETVSMNLKIREELVIQGTSASQSSLHENNSNEAAAAAAAVLSSSSSSVGETQLTMWMEHEIRSLVAFQRGFAYGCGLGTVVIFEREGQHKYTKRNVYVIPEQVSKNSSQQLKYRINCINANSSSDRIIVTSGWSQLFYAQLWGPETLVDAESLTLKIMGQNLHNGPIGDLSICAWKSVFMTCGTDDRSVRLWDYQTESMIMMKQYQEDIFSVALHPIGLFCLVGFSDKLRFMSILMDNLLTMHEIPVRNCRTVVFSQGGHLFAAVNGNIIQIYTTVGFSNRYLLKGHTGKIRCVCWSQTDMRLVSVGSEGAMYQWNMTDGTRSSEVILKGIGLKGVVLTADGTTAYCVSSDNKIREIRENSVTREFSLTNDDNMQQMMITTEDIHQVLIMGKDNFGMFVTAPGGTVVSVKYPLQDTLDTTEFHLHSANITRMCLSFDEQILVSAAEDGTLCFWRVTKIEGIPTISREGELIMHTNEVLIGKGDLEEKVSTIEELTIRMRELETEHAYKIRQTEVQHNDKIREIHEGYCEAIEELGDKIEKIQEDRANELNNINVDILRMRSNHEEAMQKMEMNYDAKLINEYDKYRDFEERNTQMRENYEERIRAMERQRIKELEAVTKKFEAQVHSKSLQLEETHEEMAHQTRVHESLKEQIEEDADREIIEVRTNYESRLSEERQTNLKLKGEAGVLRTKYFATRKEIDDLKRQLMNIHAERVQLQKTINELERDVLDLKKEISERDVTIQEKEKRIYELKRNNQELEKFKFVLNYKIRELKSQIEPRDLEIKELKEKIRDMETELINLHKTNVSLELQLQELGEKLGGSRRQIEAEIARSRRCEQILRKIRADLSEAAESIQDPQTLKNAVIKLYRCYSADEQVSRGRLADLDAKCEFSKQRDHLERTVSSLRKQVFHETSGDEGKDVDKIMDENVTLLVELNALRDDLKKACKHINDMESLLGLAGLEVGPKEARKRLADACHGKDELQMLYKTKMQDCEKIVATLQDDIKRLLADENRLNDGAKMIENIIERQTIEVKT